MKLIRHGLLTAVATFSLSCSDSEPSKRDDVAPRPERPSLRVCIVTDRYVGPFSLERLPETVSDTSETDGMPTLTARITGQAVATPGPSPGECWGFTPGRTIAFDDEGGNRWWISLSVVEGGADVTPNIAEATGTTTFTWRVATSFTRPESFSLTDGGGLLFVANHHGWLLLGPEDAGGLATTFGHLLAPVYEDPCGHFREFSVVFTTSESTELEPGRKGILPLSAGTVSLWHLDAVSWVIMYCTDLSGWVSTLAWRPAGG